MKKNFVIIALVAISCLGITGCGKKDISEVRKPESVVTTESETNNKFECNISDIDQVNYKVDSYNGNNNEIVIPDEYNGKPIIEISADVFFDRQIKTVKLGNNIQVIGEYAFSSNSDLTSVTLNEGLKEIKESAFSTSGLTGNIVIPDSVETIGVSAFGTTKLESVEFGNSIKNIAAGAFKENTTLKKVTFNNTDVEFEDGTVFEDCPNLTIVAPKGSTAEKYAKDNNINFEER